VYVSLLKSFICIVSGVDSGVPEHPWNLGFQKRCEARFLLIRAYFCSGFEKLSTALIVDELTLTILLLLYYCCAHEEKGSSIYKKQVRTKTTLYEK
jgi:hypothetical protein